MAGFDDVLREVVGGSATSGAIFDVDGKPYRIKRIDRVATPMGDGESVEFAVRVMLVQECEHDLITGGSITSCRKCGARWPRSEPEHVPSDPGARCN